MRVAQHVAIIFIFQFLFSSNSTAATRTFDFETSEVTQPGLWDSHTHTAWSNQQISEDSLIAYGVTSVRDTGGRLDMINALRNKGEATSLPAPRYVASGDIYEGLMPLWGDAFLEITDKEEAREYVRYWKRHGRILH